MLRAKRSTTGSYDYSLLLLEIPRANDKKELAAEQMLAALHGILRPKKELWREGNMQEHISMEFAAIGQRIRFYVWTPKHLQSFVEGQIYAQYPTVQIKELQEDYAARQMPQSVIHTAELTLIDHETIPIKTFPSFEVDPLASITATLSKLEQPDEEMWIQIIARPISDDWHKRGAKMVRRIKGGGLLSGAGSSGLTFLGQALTALVTPPTDSGKSPESDLSERSKTRIKAIEEKSIKLGYQVKIRVLYAGHDQNVAKLRMQAIIGTFKQFNTTNLNGFRGKNISFSRDKLAEYQNRFFIDSGYILNIEELASMFHLPHTTVETPNIVWATTKTAEPPSNIPTRATYEDKDLSLFGITNFRGTNTVFGLSRQDRSRHLYIIGQTGTGKSGLLELLVLSDIFYDQGFGIIDPHGDSALNIMRFIPERRLNDVIYINPADTDFPIGFNPLEVTDPSLKNHISSELVGVLKRMFESWGPRLEYILRYTILALLDYPNSTMLDITRMLTEKRFRDEIISYVDDPVVKNFWVTEFASWNEKFAAEAVAPVLNKVGAFTANPMIRNIVGQPKSTFNIREAMDNGKILIVNLSRGLVGEDNAAILGALMVTKIQLAAMSRANVNQTDRRPFYLYVDEFQNFATDSFSVILSEARKYGLNLTVANQYVAQMTPVVKDAVFGNVGSMVSFRVGADDASFLTKYYQPQFDDQDLIQLHNRHFVSAITIKGEKTTAFSGSTLSIPAPQGDHTAQIIQLSRQRYAHTKAQVENYIRTTTASHQPNPTQQTKNNQARPQHQQGAPKPTQQQHDDNQHARQNNTHAQQPQTRPQHSGQRPSQPEQPKRQQQPQQPSARHEQPARPTQHELPSNGPHTPTGPVQAELQAAHASSALNTHASEQPISQKPRISAPIRTEVVIEQESHQNARPQPKRTGPEVIPQAGFTPEPGAAPRSRSSRRRSRRGKKSPQNEGSTQTSTKGEQNTASSETVARKVKHDSTLKEDHIISLR